MLFGPKKVWAETWKLHGSRTRRTSEYSEDNRGENAGGFRDHRQVVDAGTSETVHPKAVSERRKQANAADYMRHWGMSCVSFPFWKTNTLLI